MKIDYNLKQYKVYKNARKLMPKTSKLWMNAIKKYTNHAEQILDLGSGTGRFSSLLANTFNAKVKGIEPSNKMRDIAIKDNHNKNVTYLEGSASNIPLLDNSCNFAWLSMVTHHIPDIEACANELNRVLKDKGMIFIRNSFDDILESVDFYRFFPSAMELDKKRLPNLEQIKNDFIKVNFDFVDYKIIKQIIDNNFKDYTERISKKALSTFELISDEEFQQGIKLMRQETKKEKSSSPIIEEIGFLVLKKNKV